MIEPVEFPSEGATLRGLLYRPGSSADGERPLVVMAHGTSATIGMVADRYAEAFCRGGLAVLLYDHRNFGRSDGEPRQEINPWIQCRGYRDAVTFAETLDARPNGPGPGSSKRPCPVTERGGNHDVESEGPVFRGV